MANKTGSQIKALAESFTEGDTITDANALLWINEFLVSNLRDKAKIKDTEDYPNSIKYTKYTIPTDFIGIYKIEEYISSGLEDVNLYRDYVNYSIDDDDISFNSDGHFKLSYFKLPTELATIGTTMTVNQIFDKSCALWVAYRHLTNDDEDNAKSQSLGQLRLQEYQYEFKIACVDRAKLYKKKHNIRRV